MSAPTNQQISAAAQESFDAFEVYYDQRKSGADTTESHARYMSAIERHADLRYQKNQALLKEGDVCWL